MITNVTVVDPRLFVRWLAGKQIEITEAMTALGAEKSHPAKKKRSTPAKRPPRKASRRQQ